MRRALIGVVAILLTSTLALADPPAGKPAHWAFAPPQRPALPKVANAGWVKTPVDAFILARLEKEGITPSPEADKATLLRRLCLDLLGLPPTPQMLDQFLGDTGSDAYERLVDSLLESPHYGERWGRYWLDAARYADSDGYEKDTGRPHAWRYRNWVIDALNKDMPFDEFTIEQLAGDLLPSATLEQKIATGFHRNTLTNKEGGVDQEQFRVEATIDRTNTTASVWLGLTMGCCQCHNHKYDPFTQQEYYRFFAFFNSVSEVNMELNPLLKQQRTEMKARHEKALETCKQRQPQELMKWEANLKPAERKKLPTHIGKILSVPVARRDEAQQKELADYFATIDPALLALKKQQADEVKRFDANQPLAQTLAEGPARTTHVLQRGDFLRPEEEVPPGVPAVLGAPSSRMKNRLDLAKWIVSSNNPLTARVFVNWVWHKHFGRGIVPTLEDFGTQGERPSHPELLDWVTCEFAAHGLAGAAQAKPQAAWSIKALHRLIVCSATYRQSSNYRPELRERDPLNVLLARQNRLRLEAEILRDCSLSCSGLLNAMVGGPSVHPPQPAGISELTYAGAAKWVESTGPDRYRRGLYTWFQRTSPYPMLMTFDMPESNVCCLKRERSNTPLQALTLMNDTVFVECAQALGRRLQEHSRDTKEKIAYAVRLCLGREATAPEIARWQKFYGEVKSLCAKDPAEAAKLFGNKKVVGDIIDGAAWVALARAFLNLDEFVTRE
ncbi:MAG TPA: DUF1553 domain-containing protein [Gemmataceae bacterium]|nr:DUF1553 domain-containing protein [Gemmataceae bacterium]